MKRITANQYQTSERYYKSPKILFEDEKYMDMKLEVKVAYSILKDRLELSLSRGWIDEEGAVYLVFSNSKLMRLLGCSKSKLLSIKKTLKEYDLIDEVQQSLSEKGRLANKIYLGELSSTPIASLPFSLEDCWTSSIKPYSLRVFLMDSNFDFEHLTVSSV